MFPTVIIAYQFRKHLVLLAKHVPTGQSSKQNYIIVHLNQPLLSNSKLKVKSKKLKLSFLLFTFNLSFLFFFFIFFSLFYLNLINTTFNLLIKNLKKFICFFFQLFF